MAVAARDGLDAVAGRFTLEAAAIRDSLTAFDVRPATAAGDRAAVSLGPFAVRVAVLAIFPRVVCPFLVDAFGLLDVARSLRARVAAAAFGAFKEVFVFAMIVRYADS
jgi:hypothetical protein